MKRVAIVAWIALAGVLLAGCGKKQETPPEEAAQYAGKISFSNFRMSAAENMAGNAVYEITANVTNGGDRTVKLLQVNALFRDSLGQVILQEPATVVNERRGPLGPHQSRDFRMGFEGIPESWTRAAPELQITKLELQ